MARTSFDPETDQCYGTQRAKVAKTYDKLRNRGNDGMAEKLRNAESTAIQLEICSNRVPDFDPEHDSPMNNLELRVKREYEELLEDGREQAAEALRSKITTKSQTKYLNRLRNVDKKIAELRKEGKADKAAELESLGSINEQVEYIDDLRKAKRKKRREKTGPRGRRRRR